MEETTVQPIQDRILSLPPSSREARAALPITGVRPGRSKSIIGSVAAANFASSGEPPSVRLPSAGETPPLPVALASTTMRAERQLWPRRLLERASPEADRKSQIHKGKAFGGHATKEIRLRGHDLRGVWPPTLLSLCRSSAAFFLKNKVFLIRQATDVSPSDEIWPEMCRLCTDGFRNRRARFSAIFFPKQRGTGRESLVRSVPDRGGQNFWLKKTIVYQLTK